MKLISSTYEPQLHVTFTLDFLDSLLYNRGGQIGAHPPHVVLHNFFEVNL